MKFSLPNPSLRKFLNSPLYVLVRCLNMPSPCCRLLTHSPSQQSPLGDFQIPNPFFMPFSHLPSNISPLFHLKIPWPDLSPFLNSPMQTPSMFLSQPEVFTFLSYLPSNISLSVTLTPSPCFRSSLSNYPKQTPLQLFSILKPGFLANFLMLKFSATLLQPLRQSAYSSSSGMRNSPLDSCEGFLFSSFFSILFSLIFRSQKFVFCLFVPRNSIDVSDIELLDLGDSESLTSVLNLADSFLVFFLFLASFSWKFQSVIFSSSDSSSISNFE